MPHKILYVIDSLRVGGSERSLVGMLPSLSERGFEAEIACFYRHEDDYVQQVIAQGHTVHCLESANSVTRVLNLRRLIREIQPDIVHTSLVTADIQGRLAAARLPVAVMTSLVNVPYAPVRLQDPAVNSTKLRIIQSLDGWTARHLTDHFHAVSHTAKRGAVTALGIRPERVTVVERGRSVALLGEPGPERRKRARAMLGLEADDEVIVNVGRQTYQKGQKFLVLATKELLKTRPNFVALIVGPPGAATDELQKLHRDNQLNDRVRFLGSRDDVAEILAAADLFIFPSLYEGLPGALIEAMALGLPIVASRIEPIEEVVEDQHNALLVTPESPSEFAAAIAQLLEDQSMATKFGDRSRTIFEERFTLRCSVSRMAELYETVLGGAPLWHNGGD